MKKIKWVLVAMFLFVGAAFLTGCEDEETVHKITLHNKSSYTVRQRISGYGWVTIEAGKKRAFDDYSFTLYEYQPKDKVIRIEEDMHTTVYKDR